MARLSNGFLLSALHGVAAGGNGQTVRRIGRLIVVDIDFCTAGIDGAGDAGSQHLSLIHIYADRKINRPEAFVGFRPVAAS